jgi:peptidoglycan/LPS O-acetylase OafA/YrhL
MAIAVVAIHTNPFDKCSITFVNEIAMTIEDMAVPFFFITSGFLLAVKWGETSDVRRNRVNKMLVYTIKLYTVWTLISIPLSVYGYVQSRNGLVSCILSYFKYFLFVGKLYNSYHLWYLLAEIYALCIISIMLKYDKKICDMLAAGVIMYAVYLVFAYCEKYTGMPTGIQAIVNLYEFVFNKGGVFTGMLYICIGIYIVEKNKHINIPGGLIMLFAGIFIKYNFAEDVGNIIASVMFFMLILKIELPEHLIYLNLREVSKYIYLTHLICFSLYTFAIGDMNKLGVDSFVATVMLSLIVSLMIIKVKRIKKENILNVKK